MTKTLLISSHATCAVTSWFSIRLQLQLNKVSKSSADVTVTDNNCIYVSILSFVKEEAAEGRGGVRRWMLWRWKWQLSQNFLKVTDRFVENDLNKKLYSTYLYVSGMYSLRFPWGIHWGLLESSCHNFCTLLFAFCNKIQFLFDMVVYLLTYPVLTFNTNPLIARCLSALCRRSWGKDYSRPPAPPSPLPPPRFGAETITIAAWELSSISNLSSGRGGAPSRFPNSGW